MPKKYDKCLKDVRKKLKSKDMNKTYKCDSKGKPNKRGRHRCKTSPYKICSRLK